MKNNSKTTANRIQTSNRHLDDLHEIIAQAESMLKKAAGDVSQETVASLPEQCASAKARFVRLFSQTKKQCVDGAKHVDARVRANPYQSLAIATGTALICGLLARRNSE